MVCFEDASRERFLMARHKDRGWEIPGGRPLEGEEPLETAVREFGEETGHVLQDPEIVVEQDREKGTFWVATGHLGPEDPSLRDEDDPVVEHRFVERVTDVQPLAFPDDPYEETGEALGRPLL